MKFEVFEAASIKMLNMLALRSFLVNPLAPNDL
jgi:hypothetical protein